MSTATNAVVENKLSPVTGANPAPQKQITGQYLFDSFMGTSDEQVTKMNIVRNMASQCTAEEVKKALADMVEIAHKVDVKNGVPEKDRGPKRHTAMNVRSVMQNVYGALRLAPKEFAAQGYTDKTGYQDAAVMARIALKAKGVKWNGTQLPTDESKALAAIKAEKDAKRDAMAEAADNNPQMEGEEDDAYALRLIRARDEILAAQKRAAELTVQKKIVDNLYQKLGREQLRAIAELALELLDATAEMTPEDADKAMREAAKAEEEAEEAELAERETEEENA